MNRNQVHCLSSRLFFAVCLVGLSFGCADPPPDRGEDVVNSSDSINSGNVSGSGTSDSIESSNGGETATSFTAVTKGQYQHQQ